MEFETEYILMHVYDSGDRDTHLAASFVWLNHVLLWFPMWTRTVPNSSAPRSVCFSFIVISLLILANLYHGVIFFIECIFWEDADLTYRIVYALAEVSLMVARSFSFYYFYREFSFPWNHRSYLHRAKNKEIIQQHRLFIAAVFALTMIAETIQCVHYINEYALQSKYLQTAAAVTRIFIFFPIDATFTTAAVVFFKCHLNIVELTECIDNDANKVDFERMLQKYDSIMSDFKSEYTWSLEWCLHSYLFAIVLDLWVSSYEIYVLSSFISSVSLLTDLSVLLTYFVSASWVADAFEKYECLLYEYGKRYPSNITHYGHFAYFLSYISRYPLAVKIGRTKITKRSAVQIAAVFVFAKLIGYSLHSFGY